MQNLTAVRVVAGPLRQSPFAEQLEVGPAVPSKRTALPNIARRVGRPSAAASSGKSEAAFRPLL